MRRVRGSDGEENLIKGKIWVGVWEGNRLGRGMCGLGCGMK